MVKKHIHHFNRGMVIGLEVIGVAALAVFAGWLFLVIRLSQGPMDATFLIKNMEQAFRSQLPGFEFSMNSMVLTWGGAGQPFELNMDHVQIDRTDKTPVLAIEKIGIQLSKRYLVFGKIVPRVIKVYGPALRIVRGEDGHYTLNVDEGAPTPEITAPETMEESETAPQGDFINAALQKLDDTGRLGLLSGLKQVSVTNAALLYEDRLLHVGWKSRNSDITLTRSRGGLLVDAIANVEMAPGQMTYLRGSFYYSWQRHSPNGVIYFTNLNLSHIAQQSEQLKDFAGVDLPLKGSISFEMDQDFKPGFGRFVLGSGPGKFNAFSFYPQPIAVQKFYAQGQYNLSTKEALVDQLRLYLDGPRVTAKASVRKQEGGNAIEVVAALEGMQMDKLKEYWPETLTPDPRGWVTGHLTNGTATRATIDLSMLAPLGDFEHLQLQKLGGEIDFHSIKVDYFPPLMPVTGVSGKATYDHKSFNLDISGGTLGDMPVTGSKIAITDLDIQNETIHSKIDINVSLNGPLRTALKVLDSKPLEYPKDLGIKTADVAGDADVEVNFSFPLHTKLAVEDVSVKAKAKLDNVLLKDMVAGMPLSGGPMTVAVDNGNMTVKGKGILGDMPVEFSWLKNFSAKAEVASKVEAKLPLNSAALAAFGVPDSLRIAGTLPADVTYTLTNAQSAMLLFKGNITGTAFTLPVANFEKTTGFPGTLDMIVHLKEGRLAQISGLNLATTGAALKGSVDFASDGKTPKKAAFDQIRLGDTDITLSADTVGSSGLAVRVSGRQFDASKLLGGDDRPGSDEEAAKPVTPMTVSMSVDRLLTGKDKHIDGIKMFMNRNGWGRIEQLEVDGVSGGKPVYLRYTPVPKGHTLRFEADNAGAALSALGITNGVRGGKIVVNGSPNPQGGKRDLRGVVTLSDFSLVNVPALAQLLNAMSLIGIVELLNGKGISFKKMRADFSWTDKGQPESARNTRLIRIKNGQTSGASLGLTFDGAIDNWANTVDMSGTIIPVSEMSKLVGIIPLVGDILTGGGGGGVFAATYTVKGPKDRPTTTVNPLSVLAPGILRKLFFEK